MDNMEYREYKTEDLFLAGTLYCKGYEFVRVDKGTEHRHSFIFVYQNGIDELANDFFNRKAQVEPIKFGAGIKKLKKTLYDLQQPIRR